MKTYECNLLYLDYPRISVSEDFIKTNRLYLSRSVDNIINKIKDSKSILNFDSEVLIKYLPWNDITSVFLKEILKQEIFEECVADPQRWRFIDDIAESVQDFLDYMVFAWGKAFNQRGLSASRSIDKLSTYLWLFGKDDLVEIIQDDSLYDPYGMPALLAVCKKLNIYVPEECIEFANG